MRGLIPPINAPFNDAYTFVDDPIGYIGAVPYMLGPFAYPPDANKRWYRFQQLYFKNRSPLNPNPASDDWWKNHDLNLFHVLDCYRFNNELYTAGFSQQESQASFNLFKPHYDTCNYWSCSPVEMNNYLNHTITHELASQFWINWYIGCPDNPPQDKNCSHCLNEAWCSNMPGCKNNDAQNQNCVDRLCSINDKAQCTSSSIRFDCNELRGSTIQGITCEDPHLEELQYHIRTQIDPE